MTNPPERMENTWKIFQLFRKNFFRPPPPPTRSANRISTATTNHRSEPGFTLSTLSEETHKSLLAHTNTPSTRYRGPIFLLSFTVAERDEAKPSRNRTFFEK
jgi:hypothetical protein